MSVKRPSKMKLVPEPRAILGPTGNMTTVRVSERKTQIMKQKPINRANELPESVLRKNVSVDSTSSSRETSRRTVMKRSSVKAMRPHGEDSDMSLKSSGPAKRCDWITPFSEPLYIFFHDEEWGVPVCDDKKLFELLVYSQALAELSWPSILNKRDIFRKLLDNFDPTSIAQFTEKKLLSLKVNGSLLLSEPKLRAVLVNAKQVLKIQLEFGSFSNYVWSFVNHKPIRNGFRYARQVPVKTPKAELISKDLMQRGFRCIGPTVIYSFMQVAGVVNDHLLSCFRYQECCSKPKIEESEVLSKALENACLSG